MASEVGCQGRLVRDRGLAGWGGVGMESGWGGGGMGGRHDGITSGAHLTVISGHGKKDPLQLSHRTATLFVPTAASGALRDTRCFGAVGWERMGWHRME